MIKRPLIAALLIGVSLFAATGADAQKRKRKPVVKILGASIRANQPVGPDESSVTITARVRARRARLRSVRAWAVLQNATNRPSQPVALTLRPNKGGWVGRVTIPRNTSTRATIADVWVEANSNIGTKRKDVGNVRVKASSIDPNQPPPPPDI